MDVVPAQEDLETRNLEVEQMDGPVWPTLDRHVLLLLGSVDELQEHHVNIQTPKHVTS